MWTKFCGIDFDSVCSMSIKSEPPKNLEITYCGPARNQVTFHTHNNVTSIRVTDTTFCKNQSFRLRDFHFFQPNCCHRSAFRACIRPVSADAIRNVTLSW